MVAQMQDHNMQCEGVKVDGSKCQAKALPGRPHCVFHDPATAEARAAGRRAGGKRRSRPAAVLPLEEPDADLGTVEGVAAFLGRCVNAVAKGRLDPKVGNCVGLLAGQLMRALADGDIERRLKDLEEKLRLKPRRA